MLTLPLLRNFLTQCATMDMELLATRPSDVRRPVARRRLALAAAVVTTVACVVAAVLIVRSRSDSPTAQPGQGQLVSVIVITHERPNFLKRTLASIAKQGRQWSLLLGMRACTQSRRCTRVRDCRVPKH